MESLRQLAENAGRQSICYDQHGTEKSFNFCGDIDVKYADGVSRAMTMVLRISGGRDTRVESVLMVFRTRIEAIAYEEF